jgi:hypothetical protein
MQRILIVAGVVAALAIVRAADDPSPAAMMARIENAQVPDRHGVDGNTLRLVME